MAYKDSPEDAALQEAWAQFCDRLKDAGTKVFKEQNPASPLHRADAYRFLTQNLGQAFDLALETKNTRYPALHLFNSPTRKLGGDCADFIYLQAWIDGKESYRITGNRGTAPFLNFTVQGPRPEKLPAALPRCTSHSAISLRPICSATSCTPHGTAVSNSSSAGRSAGRTGCPPRLAHAKFSSAKGSTAGTSCQPKCVSSAPTWPRPNPCPRQQR